MTFFKSSSRKVVKRKIEVVLPIDRVLRLFGLGKGDRLYLTHRQYRGDRFYEHHAFSKNNAIGQN